MVSDATKIWNKIIGWTGRRLIPSNGKTSAKEKNTKRIAYQNDTGFYNINYMEAAAFSPDTE